jgi:hypothetical protein
MDEPAVKHWFYHFWEQLPGSVKTGHTACPLLLLREKYAFTYELVVDGADVNIAHEFGFFEIVVCFFVIFQACVSVASVFVSGC